MQRLLLLISIPLIAVPCASGGILIVGLPPSTISNVFPFGVYNNEYQQVYTSSQFTSLGTIVITGLSFYDTQDDSGASAMSSGNWSISLSTTSADWNTLSKMFSANVGTDNKAVFSGKLAQPWTFPDTLTIPLSTPFTYNPSQGNLLMDVVASGTSITNGIISFDFDVSSTIMGRVYCGYTTPCGSAGSDVEADGLVTGFTFNNAPEPASLLLIGPCLAALAVARRRSVACGRTDLS